MTPHQHRQKSAEEFDEEVGGHFLHKEDSEEVKSFLLAKIKEAYLIAAEEVEGMKKNLVVDNWEDGQPKNCNPRCHDSGKESALTDAANRLRQGIAESK